MKEVPAKIEHNNAWLIIKLGIAEDRIILPAPLSQEILFKSVLDLAEKKNTLYITYKIQAETTIKIRTIDKVREILKKLILNSCNAYRLAVYFKAPAIRGGELIKEAKWEKGSIVVVRTSIWFVSATKQICIPSQETAAIELTKTDVQGKPRDIIRIDHVDAGAGVSSQVLCPLSALQVLFTCLKDAPPKGKNAVKASENTADELDAVSQQVAMLIYTGMDSHAIENMLNIPQKDLDGIYDKLISLGIGEVIAVRREIHLTPKGVRCITEATKTPARQ
jgi:helix-turn-helix protein